MSADYCPCCGVPFDKDESVARMGLTLEIRTLAHQGRRVRLSNCEAAVMGLILKRGRVSHEAMLMMLNEDAKLNLLKVVVHRIRLKLAVISTDLLIAAIWGWGFELVEAKTGINPTLASGRGR